MGKGNGMKVSAEAKEWSCQEHFRQPMCFSPTTPSRSQQFTGVEERELEEEDEEEWDEEFDEDEEVQPSK